MTTKPSVKHNYLRCSTSAMLVGCCDKDRCQVLIAQLYCFTHKSTIKIVSLNARSNRQLFGCFEVSSSAINVAIVPINLASNSIVAHLCYLYLTTSSFFPQFFYLKNAFLKYF